MLRLSNFKRLIVGRAFFWGATIFVAVSAATPLRAIAKDIETNEVIISGAPDWLKAPRVERITARIQSKLEWTTRKINVRWYSTPAAFAKVQTLGPLATAVTRVENGTATIQVGPTVNDKNFDEIFGHELVHVILAQKYKGAIPKWIEEGLANHLAHRGEVDYKWLAQQPLPKDVRELAHPFSGSAQTIVYHYKASQALAEMLDKKCDLDNLIRLSVERKMEDYIVSYCEIPDLNKAFKDWVKKKAQ